MKEQKLKRVTDGDRRRMLLAASQNKRHRKWQEAKLDSEFGPHTCGHCRAEPCGSSWPHAACCHRCTHMPMPRWRLTHVLWYRKKPYFVMEVAARRPGADAERKVRGSAPPRKASRFESGSRSGGPANSNSRNLEPSEAAEEQEQLYGVQTSSGGQAAATDAIYYRWDGVAQWVRRARTHYFLGVRVSPAEFLRSLPNEEELREFEPRERPPNPFEEGIAESPDGELGAPFLDQRGFEPEEDEPALPHGKQGLRFVEVGEDDEDEDEAETEGEDGEEV